MFRIINGYAPHHVLTLCPPRRSETVNYALRNDDHIVNLYCRLNPFKNSFFPYTIRHWNALSNDIKHSTTLNSFRSKLRKNLLLRPNPRWGYYSAFTAIFPFFPLFFLASFLRIHPFKPNLEYLRPIATVN